MNHQQTIERLKHLRLSVMAQLHSQYLTSHQLTETTIDQYVSLLCG